MLVVIASMLSIRICSTFTELDFIEFINSKFSYLAGATEAGQFCCEIEFYIQFLYTQSQVIP